MEWENGVTSKRHDIEEVIEATRREAAKVNTIQAEIGSWPGNRVEIRVSPAFEAVSFRMKGTRENLEKMRGFFDSLVKNFCPDYPFLYLEAFRVALLIVTLIIVWLGVTFLIYSSLPDLSDREAIPFWPMAVSMFAAFGTGFFIEKRWKSAFPLVDFQFGSGRNAGTKRRSIGYAVTVIFLPILIAFAVTFGGR
ncbi:hypothetical protein [Altererythrobacter sp. GH1-8]|uniref:hypothetical protein n=1 Tax=Altererythrobacter sp. GH1-8 TaxID=3349333 RepID=UPI00374C9E81